MYRLGRVALCHSVMQLYPESVLTECDNPAVQRVHRLLTRLDPILWTNRSPSPSQDGEGSDGEGFGAWRHKRQEARRQPLHYPKARPASALEVRCQSLAFLGLLDLRYFLLG